MRNFDIPSFKPEELPEKSDRVTTQNTEQTETGILEEYYTKGKEMIKKYALTAATASALFQFTLFEHNKVFAQNSFNERPRIVKAEDKNKIYKERKLQEVQKDLMTDTHERFMLAIPEIKGTMFEFGEAQLRTGFVKYEDIDNLLKLLPDGGEI